MDRLELVQLIEDQVTKLTPEGRELVERMELLAELPPGPDHPATHAAQRAQADQALDLSARDRSIIERLLVLWDGLEGSDAAGRRGESGERDRNAAVISAAWIKDRSEGRRMDPDMTPERAAARLKEPE